MINSINVGLEGWYKIEAITPAKDGVKESTRTLADWFPNIITNTGLDEYGVYTPKDILNGSFVGGGSTVPAVTDTALANLIASSPRMTNLALSNATGLVTEPLPYSYDRLTYTYPIGIAAGNLSEVGVGRTATALFSRALILDSNGTPTTITVLSDEILVVTYELRYYVPLNDFVTTATIGNVTYGVTVRASMFGVQNWPGSVRYNYTPNFVEHYYLYMYPPTSELGLIAGQPTLTYVQVNNNGTSSQEPYISGSYYRDTNITVTVNGGNPPGGIQCIRLQTHGCGSWQMRLDQVLPKGQDKTLSLTFRIGWGRYIS